MDFREVQVPVYINGCKSGLNRPWLERAACWKRQEVSGMLITHWNVASRALPVLALKSNYLDRWPNDCFLSTGMNLYDMDICVQCIVQLLGTHQNTHNMTYYTFLRDFTVVITSEMLLILASVRTLKVRLNGRGKEHHSQSKP